MVSSGHDSVVRVWRLPDGAPVGDPLSCHSDFVYAVAVGALPDGTAIIVSGNGPAELRRHGGGWPWWRCCRTGGWSAAAAMGGTVTREVSASACAQVAAFRGFT